MSTPGHHRDPLEILGEIVQTLNQIRDKLTNAAQDLREYQFEIDSVQRELLQKDCASLIAKIKEK